MMNIQNIQNVNDCVPLYLPHSLYLKPVARMNISVSLPSSKVGKSISNLDIMDKLSSALKPDKFLVLKVSKSTLDFIRFEAELDDRSRLRSALGRIDGISLKVSGFTEMFKVRASEAKDEFPTRHDWDSFFRDASNMDEMKAGERPDTIHFTHLPIRWFCPRHMENEDNVKPSESIFRRIFEKFGRVRNVDIPICDPYRHKMNSDINGMKTFSMEQDVLFEAYVQFEEYVGFVRAMDEFRGMKMVRKFIDKTQAIHIHVKFDKTKHLSDAQIQRRDRVRKRLISKAKSELEESDRQKRLELERLEKERKNEELLKLAELERQREREERRKEKHLKKIQELGQIEISQKIRVEERKLMIAQRKLESIRILEELFDRIKLKHMQKDSHKRNLSFHITKDKNDLRDRLVDKYKSATEKLLLDQRKKVEEIKSKTPLSGLLKTKKSKNPTKNASDAEDDEGKSAESKKPSSSATVITNISGHSTDVTSTVPRISADAMPFNPFKAAVAAAAAAAAGGGGGASAPGQLVPAYSTEVTSDWMKSLSFLPYMAQVFPGMHLFRPNFPSTHLHNYRGHAIRARGRGRGIRGRGRSAYDGSTTYYNSNRHYNYEDDCYEGGDYYHRSSHSRSNRSRVRSWSRSRSRTRSRSRARNRHSSKRSKSRSRSRSHSHSRSRLKHVRSRSDRSRSRSWTRSRSRSRSRSHCRSKSKEYRNNVSAARSDRRSKSRRRSRSKSTPPSRNNKKLVSTRRSCSTSYRSSRSRSRSVTPKAHGSKRSWSRKGSGRSSRRSSAPRVMIETDKLVRSAEEIKRNIEKDMKIRMLEEEKEIKENFRHRKHKSNTELITNEASKETNPNAELELTAKDKIWRQELETNSIDRTQINEDGVA